jgi:cytochrome P450
MSEARAVQATTNFFTDELLSDPYPVYRRFQQAGRIHPLMQGGAMWALFRHSDCSTIIRDPRLTARRTGSLVQALPPERRGEFSALSRMLGLWMLFIDAPEHTRLRKLMNKGFSPAVAEGLRPQIESIVDRMLEPLRHASEFDISNQIAYPMPVRVIAEMLGVPETLHEHFIQWSDAIALCLGNPRRTEEQARNAQEAILALTEFFRQAVAERRKKKGSDLISLLIDIEADGEVLTEDELHAQCVMLLFGGHETTRNLIGNGMYTLLRNPEAMDELRAEPEIVRTAVEELLRYESPVQYTGRGAKEEMELCGVRLNPGDGVLFVLGAANRDPEQFAEPDRLNLKRLNNAHLAFGAGAHFCIGNQLARLEGQVAILKMVQQFPKMRLATERPEWAPNFGFRGLKSLPVAV